VARSPANIAFIKFWGKKNSELNIPFNDSMSMNLSDCYTTASVEFSSDLADDLIVINKEKVEGNKRGKVVKFLDLVRQMAKSNARARVVSENNFPMAAGIASSASAFSALALAASAAAGLNLNTKQLSILARKGSGSASRSMLDGFGYWKAGTSDETSYAVQLAPKNYWNLRDIVTVVSNKEKKFSSGEGHAAALTSPYFQTRIKNLPRRLKEMKDCFRQKNITMFGELLEQEAVDLHLMAMSSVPPIFYWNEGTILIMRKLREWRNEGLLGYFTIDAGANVHVICTEEDADELEKRLKQLPGVEFTIMNRAGDGAKLL